MRLAASVETERLTWQAGTPGKPWQNFSFRHPPRFVKPSKIKPAPPNIMEMLSKKEIGTAKFIPRANTSERYQRVTMKEIQGHHIDFLF